MRGSDVGSWLPRSDKTEGARQCAVCAGPGPGKPSSPLSGDSCQADCCCSPQVEIVVGAAVILLASRAQHPAPWDSTTPLQIASSRICGGGRFYDIILGAPGIGGTAFSDVSCTM